MRTCFTVSILSLLLVSGCAEPKFSNRKEFLELEPFAQNYVQGVLTSRFGTPTDMVVWDKLPVKQHLATGSVVAAGGNKLTLTLDQPHSVITPGTEVLWSSTDGGPGGSAWIAKWDNETGAATLEQPLSGSLAAGARVILGPGQVLARGRHLYAEHCLHCHGVAGDGAGSTAAYLNPRPRDYRKGVFKFTTTAAAERAARSDLHRTIREGIPGTYMPSFKLLADDEMTSITEYILWLSMRGEMEFQLVQRLAADYSQNAVRDRIGGGESYEAIQAEFNKAKDDPAEFKTTLDEVVDLIVSRWTAAQEETALLAPKQARVVLDKESIERGRKLYLEAAQNCAACHGEAGYGDGPQTYSITKDDAGKENPLPGLYDTWGNQIVPRNLHTGVYRGGRRPIDLYARIHAGIKGTPMPAFGAKLDDQKIWDLVNYIYSVPFEGEVVEGDAPAGDPGAVHPETGVAAK